MDEHDNKTGSQKQGGWTPGREADLANDGTADFRVWWIPQVPGKAFEVPVKTWADGKALEDVLASYDAFQFENNFKPDYCNAGGTQMRHAVLTEGEWHDIDDDEAEEYGWSRANPSTDQGGE